MRRVPVCLTLLSLGLAGCAGNGPAAGAAGVEVAISRQAATSEATQRAKVHAELGRAYLQEGRPDVALDEARVSIAADGVYAPAFNLMGLIYLSLRQNDLAEQSFRRALSLAAKDPEINNDYGWFLCQTGKAREAVPYFRVAFDNPLYQTPGRALTNAGMCSFLSGDSRQAEGFLLRALRIDSRNPSANYWMAEIAYRDGRLQDARQRLKDLHVLVDPTAESAWLGVRIDRKIGDREGEARYTGLLRRKYRDSVEYLKLSRGEFD